MLNAATPIGAVTIGFVDGVAGVGWGLSMAHAEITHAAMARLEREKILVMMVWQY